MTKALKHFVIIMLATWAFIIMPSQAMAYEILECKQDGTVKSGTELYFDDPNAPASQASFCSEVKPRDPNDKSVRILSTVMCSFVLILNQVLGKVYCGLQFTLQKYVAILVSIYIAVFGVQILMGMTQLTSKEILARLAKIGLIWAFVSNYGWGVELIFKFLINFANASIWWTLSSVNDYNSYVSDAMNLPNYAGGVSGVVPAYIYFDKLIYDAVSGAFLEANSKLIAFFAVLAIAFPPIFMIAAYWLWTTFMIFVRTLISFMMSLSAIAFLVSLSPIFFCFMLFQPTMNFFETWLKFMISYSLQTLIVFACVAMWLMVMSNFIDFFNQLSSVVFEREQNLEKVGPATMEAGSIGVCPYIVSTGGNLLGPNVKCAKSDFNPAQKDKYGNLTTSAKQDLLDMINIGNNAPAQVAGPCNNPPKPGDDPNCDFGNETPAGAVQHRLTRLNYFVIYHMITLIIVAYAFDTLLKQAPYIAKELAGPQYVSMLGQGFGGLGYNKIKGGKLPGADKGGGGGGIGGLLKSDDMRKNVGGAVGEIMARERQMAANPRSAPIGKS